MLYSNSDKIKETEFVVLDEVHYVNDRDVSQPLKYTKICIFKNCYNLKKTVFVLLTERSYLGTNFNHAS